ncbi:hypothetical protein TREMEDRAFT_39596 [Tremella mesenterica DSM 1558]|uniref:uncharacterized protein n=1 Tax=Tremella mesenterica (strain ATCC 24925 / CBS 8224 / DSM 1558 / NBRC 9311 / NRRL Y-6157 / RJB 2259-6 / UBC 559-6) TaxID=578456 RepID=UPI0003F48C50|nr:uncharacterized protein TREMEDRAFT_39596 [Tremella mesenterica DSM 1558]EIW68688.1 hypothetical protein TREMEDRAFT_39596 [Tremella mesenterica DSM 1558]
MGQTCYLNSTLQLLRTIQPLTDAISEYKPEENGDQYRLMANMRLLYRHMNQLTEPIPPVHFLLSLRQLHSQFAETDQAGYFAQQDADEALTVILGAVAQNLRGSGSESHQTIDDLLGVELTHANICAEATTEIPISVSEKVLKLSCNISITTNFLLAGIRDNLTQTIQKYSPTLERVADYERKSRISRLPPYLCVHMVRFYWRRDIGKKAKIMRKVKYPLQLDLLELVTDELRPQLAPINTAMKRILADRDDRARIAKRDKSRSLASSELKAEEDNEETKRAEENKRVTEVIAEQNIDLGRVGQNPSALYELCAMVTHKGASADSGHYIGWARKDQPRAFVPSGEESWYKFDDDKVSIVDAQKILNLDGGGQDSVAYILLYRSVTA